MKTIMFRMLLMAIVYGIAPCKPALGTEWIVFDTTSTGTIYVDTSTIHKAGSRADMWVLIDYKTPQLDKAGKQVSSDKLRHFGSPICL